MNHDTATLQLALIQGAVDRQQAVLVPTLFQQLSEAQKTLQQAQHQLGEAGKAIEVKNKQIEELMQQRDAARTRVEELTALVPAPQPEPPASEGGTPD